MRAAATSVPRLAGPRQRMLLGIEARGMGLRPGDPTSVALLSAGLVLLVACGSPAPPLSTPPASPPAAAVATATLLPATPRPTPPPTNLPTPTLVPTVGSAVGSTI